MIQIVTVLRHVKVNIKESGVEKFHYIRDIIKDNSFLILVSGVDSRVFNISLNEIIGYTTEAVEFNNKDNTGE